MEESYRALFERAHARRLTAALGIAWLSFGMVGLAVFLAADAATGSFGPAGASVASFSIGSGLLAPLRGRTIDRYGTRVWLPAFAAGYGVALVAFALIAAGGSATWALILSAGLAGASAPPLVASVRARWVHVVEQPLLRHAYAASSVVADVGLVVAPAIGGLLFVAASWLPLVVCAGAAFAAALAVGRAPARGSPHLRTGGSLAIVRALGSLLAVEVALGFALGLVEVAVPADATRWRETAYSGLLLGAFAAGSVVGGIWFGGRDWKSPPERRYAVASLVLAGTLALPVVAADAPTLAALLIVCGLGYGPATISLFEALDARASGRATEALTWVTVAGAAGTAGGSAAAGWLSGHAGSWTPFAAASLSLGIVASSVLRRSRRTARRRRSAPRSAAP